MGWIPAATHDLGLFLHGLVEAAKRVLETCCKSPQGLLVGLPIHGEEGEEPTSTIAGRGGQGRVLSCALRCAPRWASFSGSAVGWAGGKCRFRCGRNVLGSNRAVEGRWQPGTGLSGGLVDYYGLKRAGGDGILLVCAKWGGGQKLLAFAHALTNVALGVGSSDKPSCTKKRSRPSAKQTVCRQPGCSGLQDLRNRPYLETLCPGRARQNLSTVRLSGYKARMWGVSKSMLAFPPKFCSARGGPGGARPSFGPLGRVE